MQMNNIESLRTSLNGKIAFIKAGDTILMKIHSKYRFFGVYILKKWKFVTTTIFRRRKTGGRRGKTGSQQEKQAAGAEKQALSKETRPSSVRSGLPAQRKKLPAQRKKLPAAIDAAGSSEYQLLYKIHDLRDVSGAEL